MYGHRYSKSTDKSGKVANPARGQLHRRVFTGTVSTFFTQFSGCWWRRLVESRDPLVDSFEISYVFKEKSEPISYDKVSYHTVRGSGAAELVCSPLAHGRAPGHFLAPLRPRPPSPHARRISSQTHFMVVQNIPCLSAQIDDAMNCFA